MGERLTAEDFAPQTAMRPGTISEVPALRFCKDCRFLEGGATGDIPLHPKCLHQQAMVRVENLVTGVARDDRRFAEHQRREGDETFCGRAARYFEPHA